MSTNVDLQFQPHDQYFTFILDGEEYGIDILSVVEIRKLERMTSIPSAPKFIKGVINLRGTIIPVMDLRERFNLQTIPYGRSTVLIVLQVNSQDKTKKIGIIVDAVSDVYKVNASQIQAKPEICNTAGHEYIWGLVTVSQDGDEDNKDKLIILLDVTKLLTLQEFQQLPAGDKELNEKD